MDASELEKLLSYWGYGLGLEGVMLTSKSSPGKPPPPYGTTPDFKPNPNPTPDQIGNIRAAAARGDWESVLLLQQAYGMSTEQVAAAVGISHQDFANFLMKNGAAKGYGGSPLVLSPEEVNAGYESAKAAAEGSGQYAIWDEGKVVGFDEVAFRADYAAGRFDPNYASAKAQAQASGQYQIEVGWDEGAPIYGFDEAAFNADYAAAHPPGSTPPPAGLDVFVAVHGPSGNENWEPDPILSFILNCPYMSLEDRAATLEDLRKKYPNIMEMYGGEESLPDTPEGRAMAATYGIELATYMWRLQLALARAGQDFANQLTTTTPTPLFDENGNPNGQGYTHTFADPKALQASNPAFAELGELVVAPDGTYTFQTKGPDGKVLAVHEFTFVYGESGFDRVDYRLNPGIEGAVSVNLADPPDIIDVSKVFFLPGVGFVTGQDNIKQKTDWFGIAIIVVIVVIASMAGGAAGGQAAANMGLSASTGYVVAAGAAAGAANLTSQLLTTGSFHDGKFFRAVLTAMVLAYLFPKPEVDTEGLVEGGKNTVTNGVGVTRSALVPAGAMGPSLAAVPTGTAAATATELIHTGIELIVKTVLSEVITNDRLDWSELKQSLLVSLVSKGLMDSVNKNLSPALDNGFVKGGIKALVDGTMANLQGKGFMEAALSSAGSSVGGGVAGIEVLGPGVGAFLGSLLSHGIQKGEWDSVDFWRNAFQAGLTAELEDLKATSSAAANATPEVEGPHFDLDVEAGSETDVALAGDVGAGEVLDRSGAAGADATPEVVPEGKRVVRAGEHGGSLERVARSELGPGATQHEINTYVGQLFELNGISDPRSIRPDQELVLPDQQTAAPTRGLSQYGRDIQKGEQDKAVAREREEAAQREAAHAMGDVIAPPERLRARVAEISGSDEALDLAEDFRQQAKVLNSAANLAEDQGNVDAAAGYRRAAGNYTSAAFQAERQASQFTSGTGRAKALGGSPSPVVPGSESVQGAGGALRSFVGSHLLAFVDVCPSPGNGYEVAFKAETGSFSGSAIDCTKPKVSGGVYLNFPERVGGTPQAEGTSAAYANGAFRLNLPPFVQANVQARVGYETPLPGVDTVEAGPFGTFGYSFRLGPSFSTQTPGSARPSVSYDWDRGVSVKPVGDTSKDVAMPTATDWGDDLQIGFSQATNTLDKGITLLGVGLVDLGVRLFNGKGLSDDTLLGQVQAMEDRVKRRQQEQVVILDGREQGLSGQLISGIPQILSMPLAPAEVVHTLHENGESKGTQVAGALITTAGNVLSLGASAAARPLVVAGTKSLVAAVPGLGTAAVEWGLSAVTGVAANVTQDVATRSAITATVETPKSQEQFEPTWESTALAAGSGIPLGVGAGRPRGGSSLPKGVDWPVVHPGEHAGPARALPTVQGDDGVYVPLGEPRALGMRGTDDAVPAPTDRPSLPSSRGADRPAAEVSDVDVVLTGRRAILRAPEGDSTPGVPAGHGVVDAKGVVATEGASATGQGDGVSGVDVAHGMGSLNTRQVGGYYVPRDLEGQVVPLDERVVKGVGRVPLPLIEAEGRPHTAIGGRTGQDETIYRQTATFESTSAPWPPMDGQAVPWGRVDWSSHPYLVGDLHPDPHIHLMVPSGKQWYIGDALPFPTTGSNITVNGTPLSEMSQNRGNVALTGRRAAPEGDSTPGMPAGHGVVDAKGVGATATGQDDGGAMSQRISNSANAARNQPYGNGGSASPSPGPNAAGNSGRSVRSLEEIDAPSPVGNVRGSAGEGAIRPGDSEFVGPAFLFRGDTRHPKVLFREGFQPRGTNLDLEEYVSLNTLSGYVSTSKTPEVARGFAGKDGYVYTIRWQPNGIDVNATLGDRVPFAYEMEISVPGGIKPADIMGVQRVTRGPDNKLRFVGPFLENSAWSGE